MKTTVTIDDDLADLLRRRTRESGKPFRQIVNDTLRKGLSDCLVLKGSIITVRPHDFGGARVDVDRANQFVNELAVEDYLRKSAKDDSA